MAKTFTPADRIRDLSDIGEETSKMLTSAGLAIISLTGRSTNLDKNSPTAAVQDSDFETHAREYYTRLQAIIARLRRQAIALEEAGIISAESATLSTSTGNNNTTTTTTNGNTKINQSAGITNGGLGNLDVGWLNSRGNKIAKEKEQEVMTDMKTLLEQVLARTDEDMTGERE